VLVGQWTLLREGACDPLDAATGATKGAQMTPTYTIPNMEAMVPEIDVKEQHAIN
jgi:hypothetical protein